MKPRKPLRRTPLKRVSKKRAGEMRQYTIKRKAFLERFPICQVWLKENGFVSEAGSLISGAFHDKAPRSTEVHHTAGRSKNYLNEATWLAVSAEAHRRIHQNPSWARANGFLL